MHVDAFQWNQPGFTRHMVWSGTDKVVELSFSPFEVHNVEFYITALALDGRVLCECVRRPQRELLITILVGLFCANIACVRTAGLQRAFECAQGQSLGSAAHLRSLRREGIGSFSVEDAWDFQELLALATQRKAEQRAAQQRSSEEPG